MTTQPDVASASKFPAASEEEWLAAAEKVLKGKSFKDVLVSTTYDGIEIQPLYRSDSVSTASQLPGARDDGSALVVERPLSRSWIITSQPQHPDPKSANEELLGDLEGGAEGVHLVLDMFGRAETDGIVVGSNADMATALRDVLFDLVPICLSAGSDFSEAAAMLVEIWNDSTASESEVSGTFGADPVGHLLTAGTLPQGIESAMKSVSELCELTAKSYPNVTAVEISSAPISNAGGSDSQELAYLMAATVEYLRPLIDAGMSAEAALAQISWTTTSTPDVFGTVSKLRAARRLWAHLGSLIGAEAKSLRLSAISGERSITRFDPWVNMLRGTASCFAAAVGGADAVEVAPFDSALGVPTAHGRRVARNTQLLLREESHLAEVIDPAAGSFYVETYTAELVDAAWDLFVEIESSGGVIEAVRSGAIASQVEAVRSVREHNVARRKDPITGVSEFPNVDEKTPVTVEVDRAPLRAAASANAPSRDSGAAIEVEPLASYNLAAPFEEMRTRSNALAATGERPKVFLANLGPVAVHTARAAFASNLFQAGGFEVVENDGFERAEDAAKAFGESGASLAVICSSDDVYLDIGAKVAAALKARDAKGVYLAGKPANSDALLAGGVNELIFMGCNVISVLTDAWSRADTNNEQEGR